MSNRNVPAFFAGVVAEVTKNIESDFREYGVSQDVLSNLKTIWMEKIVQSHVADFQAETVTVAQPQAALPAYVTPGHPMAAHMMLPTYASAATSYVSGATPVKNEPVDPRYALGGAGAAAAYAIPTLPGPQLGARSGQNGATTTTSPLMAYQPTRYTPSNGTTPTTTSSSTPRIPQVDGPSTYESEDDDEDSGPSQSQYAPRTLHPSLPQPQQPQQKASADDEAINSDLDDSDDEEGGGDENGNAESDIMFCTYDKVARVKNKWKCVLKDGVVHINGKDWLFQKCTGEFEW